MSATWTLPLHSSRTAISRQPVPSKSDILKLVPLFLVKGDSILILKTPLVCKWHLLCPCLLQGSHSLIRIWKIQRAHRRKSPRITAFYLSMPMNVCMCMCVCVCLFMYNVNFLYVPSALGSL